MIFDELGFAQKMHDTQSFIKSFNSSELGIYGRWLKLKRLEEIGKDYSTATENELEDIENSFLDIVRCGANIKIIRCLEMTASCAAGDNSHSFSSFPRK